MSNYFGYTDKLKELNKRLESNPKDTAVLFDKGKLLIDLESYEWAELIFDFIDEINPNHGYALLYKADCLVELGRYEEAFFTIDKAVRLAMNIKYKALLEAAEYEKSKLYACSQTNNFDSIKRKKIVRNEFSNPISESAKIWTYKGLAFFLRQKYEDAIAHFDKALRFDQNNFFPLYFMAETLRMLKRYSDAEIFYNKAFSIESDNFHVLFYKAIGLTDKQRYEEATKCYEKALNVYMTLSKGLYYR